MSAPHPRTTRSGHGLRILRAAVFAAVCVVLAGVGHVLGSCAAIPLWTLVAGFLGVLLVTVPLTGRERSLPGTAGLLAVGQTVLHTLFGLGQHGTMAGASSASAASSVSSASVPASDAALVEQAARLLCGTAAAAISPAQAQRILTEARIGTGAGTGAHLSHRSADAMSLAANSSASSASSASSLALLPSLPMLLAHVLAAVVAGWLLRRGDLALLRIAEMSTLSAHSVAEGAFVRSLRGALALVRALRAGLPGAPEAGPRFLRTESLARPAPRTVALQHTVIRRGPPATALALAA
ncbi:hypothetical protein [Streptomyces caeruleatus]|uniref:Integral membrane protein n=1 Tax=Streptomyces caeruleatus TaxID=661399 RepID=A0A101TXL5_9ACTN|nr:hypothetical protein [Streptomyces caeruleatus]KUO00330.1 hypothetical protein AQJ67_23780 [Streptomyces caeruleatus]